MSGGSSGNARIIKKEDLDSVKASISDKIKNRLTEMFLKQKPEGYLLLPMP